MANKHSKTTEVDVKVQVPRPAPGSSAPRVAAPPKQLSPQGATRRSGRALPPTPQRRQGISETSKQRARPIDQESWLKSINPYYAALANPMENRSARIPDMVTTRSSTFSVVRKGEFSSNAAGFAAITFGGCGRGALTNPSQASEMMSMLIPTCTMDYSAFDNEPGQGDNAYVAGFLSTSAMTALDLFPEGATPIVFDGWSAATESVPKTFSRVRLVSAQLTVACVGAAISTQGRMIGVSLPRLETLRGPLDDTLSVELLENKPGATSVFCNAMQPITVLYAPTDNESWNYAPLPDADAPGHSGVLNFTRSRTVNDAGDPPFANAPFVWPDGGYAGEDEIAHYSPGEMWVVIAGAPSVPFSYQLVANYEAIPRQAQTMLVETHTSHSDPVAAATALNAIAKMPKVERGSQVPTVQRSGWSHTTKPPPEPMINKILRIVGNVGQVAMKAAPIVAALL